MNTLIHIFTETGFPIHIIVGLGLVLIFTILLQEDENDG